MTEYPRSGESEGVGTMPRVAARREASGGSGMRSPRGFQASVVLVLALPVAILVQALIGSGASLTMHVALTVGCVLLSLSAFDFETPRWVAWIGRVTAGTFAAVFLLQAASELIHIDSFSYFALQVLGNWPERVLVTLLVFWLVAVLLNTSRGGTRSWGSSRWRWWLAWTLTATFSSISAKRLHSRRCICCLSCGSFSRAGRESPRSLRSAPAREQWCRVPRGRDVRAGSRRGGGGGAY
jgi:hypothetical protein